MPKPSVVLYQPFASAAQITLINSLLSDMGFASSVQRKEFLRHRFNKSFPDDLTKPEASRAIDELLQVQKRRTQQGHQSRDDEQ